MKLIEKHVAAAPQTEAFKPTKDKVSASASQTEAFVPVKARVAALQPDHTQEV